MKKSHTLHLHLFVLVAFAVAQPVYDLLGKNPEFFVAHSAKPYLIISMIFVLSFGLAIVLFLWEIVTHLFGERVWWLSHCINVFFLTVAIAIPLLKKITALDFLIVCSAVLFGLLFTVMYARLSAVRMFITVLLPVTLIFPIWFICATPIGSLLAPKIVETESDIAIANTKPVIVMVFDELTTTALLDKEGRIDSVRFPNFADLSKKSWWYPNAVAPYFTTTQSVPSILTGRKPLPKKKLVPTAGNYPQSLFSILRDQYRLNVFEPVTEMYLQQGNTNTQQQYVAYFADIFAIYLHMIAPPIIQQKLPKFGGQWAGFGKFLISYFYSENETISSKVNLKGWEKRDIQIERLLSGVEKTTIPVLHFFHLLLPHVPFEFLASGNKYNPSPNYPFPDGMTKNNETWIWTGEESLILTSYHQYLQQVGYADQFLGRLNKKLEAVELYDDALIIVTADHGASFQRGSSQRLIDNKNARDILQIPMFVKLPKQREGHISEKLVSGFDVLPTIADVLGANVPWVMDGQSMLSDKDFSRTEIEIPEVGHFKADDLKGFPRLKWQVEHFGTNTSLDHLSPAGPYHELIGQKLDSLQFHDTGDLKLRSEDFEYFNEVNLDSSFLPALFKANIEGTDERNLSIAITLNGRIWATTKTSEWDGKHNYFSVLFPRGAFIDGRNLVEAYIIDNKENSLMLQPLVHEGLYKIKLQTSHTGKDSLIFYNGREVLVDNVREDMDGYIDWVTRKGGMVIFEGWAADLVESQPASDVLIFKEEKLVWQVSPTYRREGVVKAFNRPTLLRSGYRARVPLRILESHSGDINVIALSKDKRAFRIHIKDEYKKLIRKTLSE